MIGLDTNVIIRYIMQDDTRQAAKANALIDGLTTESLCRLPPRADGIRRGLRAHDDLRRGGFEDGGHDAHQMTLCPSVYPGIPV